MVAGCFATECLLYVFVTRSWPRLTLASINAYDFAAHRDTDPHTGGLSQHHGPLLDVHDHTFSENVTDGDDPAVVEGGHPTVARDQYAGHVRNRVLQQIRNGCRTHIVRA